MKISRLHIAIIAIALLTACTYDAAIEEDPFAAPVVIAADDPDWVNPEQKKDEDSDPDLEAPESIGPDEGSETGNQEQDNIDIDTDSAENENEIDEKKKGAAADPELEGTEIPVGI